MRPTRAGETASGKSKKEPSERYLETGTRSSRRRSLNATSSHRRPDSVGICYPVLKPYCAGGGLKILWWHVRVLARASRNHGYAGNGVAQRTRWAASALSETLPARPAGRGPLNPSCAANAHGEAETLPTSPPSANTAYSCSTRAFRDRTISNARLLQGNR
jgi:hypothetical protein